MDYVIALVVVAALVAGGYALYKQRKQKTPSGGGIGGGPGITPDAGDNDGAR